jgi:hypothetical protein
MAVEADVTCLQCSDLAHAMAPPSHPPACSIASTSSGLGASATLRPVAMRPFGHSGTASIRPLSQAARTTVRTRLIGPLVCTPSVWSSEGGGVVLAADACSGSAITAGYGGVVGICLGSAHPPAAQAEKPSPPSTTDDWGLGAASGTKKGKPGG